MFALALLGLSLPGCGGGSDKPQTKGGAVGFVTGTEAPGPVPSAAAPTPQAPAPTEATVSSPTIATGQPVRVNITFSDPQGDVSIVNFGIAGGTTHQVLSVGDLVAGRTSGTLTLDLYPANYVPGTHVLLISLTDAAGNTSPVITVTFVIAGPGVAVDAGATVPKDSAVDTVRVDVFGAPPDTRADGAAVPTTDVATGSTEAILFKMESLQGVSYNPPNPTIFTLSQAATITRVWTYHYAATIGAKSPTVAFKDTTTGALFGPWPQIGYTSFNGTLGVGANDPGNRKGPPDNYWMAYPGQTVPAGTYQVIDSEPSTWAYTADLGNRGSAWVYGWYVGGVTDGGVLDVAVPTDVRPVDAAAPDARPADAPAPTSDTAADVPVGPTWSAPVLIETGTPAASAPQLAIDGNGNLMAVWVQGDGTTNNVASIYANRYTAGAGWGTPTLLETSDMPADTPLVAFDGNGNALAVWHQAWKTVNGVRYGIYSNRYVAGVGWGTAAAAYANTANEGVTADLAQLAIAPSGNATIAFTIYEWSWNHTSSHIARFVPATGWAASEAIDTGTANAVSPTVAMDATGNALILWIQAVGTTEAVFANRYIPGTGFGKAVQIDTTPRGSARGPQVVFAPDGSAMAAWYNYGLRGVNTNRFVPATGWGTATLLTEAGESGYDEGARLAIDKTGNAALVWNRYGGAFFASRSTAAGTWATPVTVEPIGQDYSGQIAFTPAGVPVTVWGQYSGNSYNIWSSSHGAAGWSSPVRVNTTPDNAGDPHLVVDKNGTATVIWTQSGNLYAATAAF